MFGNVTISSLAYSIVADVKGFVAGMNEVQKEGDETEKTFNDMANDAGVLNDEIEALAKTYEMIMEVIKATIDLWVEQSRVMNNAIHDANKLNVATEELLGIREASQEWFNDPEYFGKLTKAQQEQVLAVKGAKEELQGYIDAHKELTTYERDIRDSNQALNDLSNAWGGLKDTAAIALSETFKGLAAIGAILIKVVDKTWEWSLALDPNRWMRGKTSDWVESITETLGLPNGAKWWRERLFDDEDLRSEMDALRAEFGIGEVSGKGRRGDGRIPGVSFGSESAYKEISEALTDRQKEMEKTNDQLDVQKKQLTEQQRSNRFLEEISGRESGRTAVSVSLF